MTRRALELLLRLSPSDFRARCGTELLEAHDWRAGRRSTGTARALLSAQELVGLSTVVARLRLRAAASSVSARLRRAGIALRPDPGRWGGAALAGGALMIVVATGAGFGAGVESAFTLVPVSLLSLGWGLAGRARSTAALSRVTMRLAGASGALAVVLAVFMVLTEFAPAPLDAWSAVLRYPAYLGFALGTVALGVRGMLLRELPAAPAATVVVGMLMLLSAFVVPERVAELGVWVSLVGWVSLAATPWGPPNRIATR